MLRKCKHFIIIVLRNNQNINCIKLINNIGKGNINVNNFNTINIVNTTTPNQKTYPETEGLQHKGSKQLSLKNVNVNIAQCNCEENKQKFSNKLENYNNHLQNFFTKIKKLCDTSGQIVKWMEQSYKWVESRYLKTYLKNIKINKEESKDKRSVE